MTGIEETMSDLVDLICADAEIARLRAETERLRELAAYYSSEYPTPWRCPKCGGLAKPGFICSSCRYDPSLKGTDDAA